MKPERKRDCETIVSTIENTKERHEEIRIIRNAERNYHVSRTSFQVEYKVWKLKSCGLCLDSKVLPSGAIFGNIPFIVGFVGGCSSLDDNPFFLPSMGIGSLALTSPL